MDGFFASPSTSKLTDVFHSLDYDFDRIRSGEGRVPRLFLAALPADMVDIRESKVRKSLFSGPCCLWSCKPTKSFSPTGAASGTYVTASFWASA